MKAKRARRAGSEDDLLAALEADVGEQERARRPFPGPRGGEALVAVARERLAIPFAEYPDTVFEWRDGVWTIREPMSGRTWEVLMGPAGEPVFDLVDGEE